MKYDSFAWSEKFHHYYFDQTIDPNLEIPEMSRYIIAPLTKLKCDDFMHCDDGLSSRIIIRFACWTRKTTSSPKIVARAGQLDGFFFNS